MTSWGGNMKNCSQCRQASVTWTRDFMEAFGSLISSLDLQSDLINDEGTLRELVLQQLYLLSLALCWNIQLMFVSSFLFFLGFTLFPRVDTRIMAPWIIMELKVFLNNYYYYLDFIFECFWLSWRAMFLTSSHLCLWALRGEQEWDCRYLRP